MLDYGRPSRSSTAITQTIAMFVDAYRELNARRLFWIVLVLSVLVVITFSLPGINARGITLFKFEFEGAWNTHLMTPGQFYKTIFAVIAIPLWLAWAAIILALLSTASIFPDFLAGGSVDLYLSKPISRVRLFLTKYLTGLMFVALQVLVFSTASFLAIGIRGQAWEPGVFLAVPIVVLLFSYLFAICTLSGVITRSTLAAILITLIAWTAIASIDWVEQTTLKFQIAQQRQIASFERIAASDQETIEKFNASLGPNPTTNMSGGVKAWEFQRDSQLRQRDDKLFTLKKLQIAHRIVFDVKAFLPKTGETTHLLTRWLTRVSDLPGLSDESEDEPPRRHHGPIDTATKVDFEEELRERPASWIIGTSLGFEAVMILLSAWVFCRRDY